LFHILKNRKRLKKFDLFFLLNFFYKKNKNTFTGFISRASDEEMLSEHLKIKLYVTLSPKQFNLPL